ncbi:MAG: PRC-barrel domain-containing protein [Patescibacteria group bacterium]
MALNSKRLEKTTVFTQSGIKIGRLSSLEIDEQTGKLIAIKVLTPGLVPHLMNEELMINWPQIVSMSLEKIIIVDASVPASAKLIAKGVPTGF